MKKAIILLFIAMNLTAQQSTPIIGIAWSGGLDYKMEQEIPSGKIGYLKALDQKKYFLNGIELSANYYYDIVPENINRTEKDFYNVKIQVTRSFIEYWNVVAYGGYINAFSGDLMKSYNGEFRTNLSWGVGIQTFDEFLVGEVLFEKLAGYPHLSVGLTYKILNSKTK